MLQVDKFVNWLNKELQHRGWIHADIAKYGGISRSAVSRVINGRNAPGLEFCRAVARAFRIPIEEVFRQANWLPSLPKPVANEHELTRLFRQLGNDALRTAILAQLRVLVRPLSHTVAESSVPYITHLDPDLITALDRAPLHIRRQAEQYISQLLSESQWHTNTESEHPQDS